MGLDVVYGGLEGELSPILEDVLLRHSFSFGSLELGRGDTPGRAYALRHLSDFANEGDLNYPQIKRITCSCYQMIVPFEFEHPIKMFEAKNPPDYPGAWLPSDYHLTDEEWQAQQNCHEKEMRDRGFFRFSPAYPYFIRTKWSDVYLLSSQTLIGEAVQFLDQFAPSGWREEGFNWYQKGFHPRVNDAAFLYNCCLNSIRNNVVLWFCG